MTMRDQPRTLEKIKKKFKSCKNTRNKYKDKKQNRLKVSQTKPHTASSSKWIVAGCRNFSFLKQNK